MLASLKRPNHNQKLALVLVLYLVLAIAYSIVVPIGRGADEWAHYWYAQFIAQNGRLPANAAEREIAGYKSDWPPRYHLFAAGLTAWVDTDGPPVFKYRADNIRRQLVPAQGPEAILHTEDELFPWQQEILVWHLGRFLSIGFSLGTLAITYLIALEIFTSSKVAGSNKSPNLQFPTPYRLRISPHFPALISAAFLAFNPRFLFTGMLFNYDSLTLLLASLFLWMGIRVVKGYYPRWGFWGLGALAGLALITKYLAALLPLEILIFAFINSANQQNKEEAHHAKQPLVARITRPFLIHLAQAALAFLFVTSWWFGYLLVNFNEIDTYGPVLGTIAPLLRGDSSDRTVEEIFAWLSGGQAPPPAHIDKQSHTLWQIIAELPTTFWGNPVVRPYPLNWFIWLISLIVMTAAGGLALFWWAVRGNRLWINLLLLHCALPVPFMLIRLFGARDALEAVQGRHILFLSGPAATILLMLGLWAASRVFSNVSRVFPYLLRLAPYLSRIMFSGVVGLLLTGALSQLIFMANVYGDPLPVRTTPYLATARGPIPSITLPGGATLIDYRFVQLEQALQVSLIWQGGDDFAPEDYQVELQLVNDIKQPQAGWSAAVAGWQAAVAGWQAAVASWQAAVASWQAAVAGWQAYQTQARYPNRAWEPGDIIRDAGWLPLTGLAAGDYQVQLRILGQDGPVIDWQTLEPFTLWQMTGLYDQNTAWTLWRNGQPIDKPVTFNERETAQLTFYNPKSKIQNPKLVGPDNMPHQPVSTGSNWANFIIGPDWPPGNYRLDAKGKTILQVAPNHRNFQLPAEMAHQLNTNFSGQVKLLGYTLPTRRIQPGDGLPITLYWQGLQWIGEDFVIFDRLLDNQQVVWGGYDRLPGENYSALLWSPGEIVSDGFAVPVASDAPNGVYTLNVGLYRRVNGKAESLLILNPETGEPTDASSVAIGPIKVGGPPPGATVTEVKLQTKVNVILGDQIQLLGFDLPNEQSGRDTISLAPASPNLQLPISNYQLPITLYWQALTRLDADYTVFAHLRNAAGETAAQKDAPPAGGAYPTGLWDTGEIIKDDLSIPLEGLEPGRYELVVGLYDFATGLRLSVDGSPDGAILLQSFEVVAK